MRFVISCGAKTTAQWNQMCMCNFNIRFDIRVRLHPLRLNSANDRETINTLTSSEISLSWRGCPRSPWTCVYVTVDFFSSDQTCLECVMWVLPLLWDTIFPAWCVNGFECHRWSALCKSTFWDTARYRKWEEEQQVYSHPACSPEDNPTPLPQVIVLTGETFQWCH